MATVGLQLPDCNPMMDRLELFPEVVVETRFLVETEVVAVRCQGLHISMERHFQYTIDTLGSCVYKHQRDHAC